MDESDYLITIASSVYDYHSDESDIINDLHEDLGVWLMDLLKELSSDCSATSDHAAQQLRTCMIRDRTREYVQTCFFRSSFANTVASAPTLFQDNFVRVLLFKRILDYFPEVLSEQLIHLDGRKRLKVLMIFISMFKSANEQKYPFVYRSVQSEPLLSRLISRYRDADESVRMEWTKLASMVMKSNLNTNGLRDEVYKCLIDMLMRERVPEVRSEALTVVDDSVLGKDHVLDPQLTMALIHRVGDTVREIRMQAIPAVQRLYKRMIRIQPDHPHRYRVASSMLLLYKQTDNQQEQFTMERALYKTLIDVMNQDTITRTENIINTLLKCTNKAVAGVAAAVTRAKSLRIVFLKLLIAQGEGNKSSYRRQIQKLSTFFDWHNDAVEQFTSILAQVDDELFPLLLRIFSDASDVTFDETIDSMQRFTNLTDDTSLSDLHYDFLIRSGVFLNDQVTHKALIDRIEQLMSRKEADVVRCSSLMLFWMSIYDRFFDQAAVQNYLKQMLQQNPQCLRILFASRDKLKLGDEFWNACLPVDAESPVTPNDEVLSGSSASTTRTRFTPSPGNSADDGEEAETDDHVYDMDIDKEIDSRASGDDALEKAVISMAEASVSLVGDPILSESSSPDQTHSGTDMSLE